MNKRRLLFVFISALLCTFHTVCANNPKDLVNWTDGGKDYGDKYAYDTSWYQSSASEYTISTPEQLAAFANATATDAFEGKKVTLAADLNMTKYGWVSIGKAGFKGTFDGAGHTITGMTYKKDDQVKSWGLFNTVDGGTVKNVLVTNSKFMNDKAGTDCSSVGGIASVLKGNGTINNTGFSGTVSLPFANGATLLGKKNGMLGGIVGIIESGTVSNSFVVHQNPVLPNDTIYGQIAGRSNGTISNCYYLQNETYPDAVNKSQSQGAQQNVSGKTDANFTSGEVAYLLNTGNAGAWGQNGALPGLTNEKLAAAYKINYPEEQPHGKVEGLKYANAGQTVTLVSVTDEGYIIKNLKVEGATLVNYTSFVMPESDVTVSYEVAEMGDNVVAYPAEEVKSKSFVAKWSKIDGASDYKITVKKGDVVLEAYNALSVGDVTSTKIEGLTPGSVYSYTVQSVIEGIVSEASNRVEVATIMEARIISTETHCIRVEWDAVEGTAKYVLALTNPKGTSITKETTTCNYQFNNLAVGTSYTVVVTAKDASDGNLNASEPVVATTDSDFGHQLSNSTFEAWHKEGNDAEPMGWHSFMSGGGSFAGFTKTVHMDKSNVLRPGTTGEASVRIWTEPVFGVPANGNLTTGKINSGSMTAKDQANHNRSMVDDPEFCQSLNGSRPDSLTVWVNFSHSKTDVYARVAATIHDKYNFADPSAKMDSLHAVAKAELDYKAVDPKGGWQRLTIPFDYELKHFDAFYARVNQDQKLKDELGVEKIEKPTSADYMLVTFTTNKTPGVGTANDQVIIDDMLLIYKPELKVVKTSFADKQISVEYALTGTMSPSNLNLEPNVVSLELSNAEGLFDEPKVLTQVITDKGGILQAIVEEDLTQGNYKVRVVTTNYPMVSDEIDAVTGTAVVKAIAATNISSDSFMANWEAPKSQQPTDYKLTVKEGETIVAGYDDKLVGNVTNYLVEGLKSGVTYHYSVKGVYGEQETEASNVITVTTQPLATALDATEITESSFTANWLAPVGDIQPTDYLLTVREGEEEFELQDYENVSVGTVNAYAVSNLKPNVLYTYSVKAVYGDNVLKASNKVTVVTAVATITAKAASSVTDSSFVANWNAPTTMSPTAYRLTVKEGDVVLAEYNNKEVSAENTKQSVTGLKPNTLYTYTVKAVYGDKESSQTEAIEVTTKVPVVKALEATEIAVVSFVANWEAPKTLAAVDYLITVKEDGTTMDSYKDLSTGAVTSLKVEGLKEKTKYTYSVKAVYGDELIATASNAISVTTLEQGVGIENEMIDGQLHVYPNPVVEVLYIKGVAVDADYTIYDMSGRVVRFGKLSSSTVNVNDLKPGVYFIGTDLGKAKFIKK